MTIRRLGLLVMLLAFATSAAAQRRVERFASAPVASAPAPGVSIDDDDRRTAILAAGGVLGGVTLTAIGAMAGYVAGCGADGLDPDMPEEDYCGFVAFPGALLGEIVGVPVGVHLANRGRGSFGYDVLASAAAAVVGGGLLVLTGEGAGVALPFVLAGQVATVIAVERATADDDYDDDGFDDDDDFR